MKSILIAALLLNAILARADEIQSGHFEYFRLVNQNNYWKLGVKVNADIRASYSSMGTGGILAICYAGHSLQSVPFANPITVQASPTKFFKKIVIRPVNNNRYWDIIQSAKGLACCIKFGQGAKIVVDKTDNGKWYYYPTESPSLLLQFQLAHISALKMILQSDQNSSYEYFLITRLEGPLASYAAVPYGD